MKVFQATVADTAEILANVHAKAEFDRGLGSFIGELGTTEDLIRQHMFGQQPVAFALLSAGTSMQPLVSGIHTATRMGCYGAFFFATSPSAVR